MKQSIVILSFLFILSGCKSSDLAVPKMGDIIFQQSKSSQSKAIEDATGSKITHMGIIIIDNSIPHVYEASNVVKITPLSEWVLQGENEEYLIKRLKNSKEILTSETLLKMLKVARELDNKPYDVKFQWSDEKLYCSEFVWKVFKNGAGIELCPLKKFSDYNLESEEVKKLLEKRYNKDLNKNEPVVAPVDIYESEILHDIRYK